MPRGTVGRVITGPATTVHLLGRVTETIQRVKPLARRAGLMADPALLTEIVAVAGVRVLQLHTVVVGATQSEVGVRRGRRLSREEGKEEGKDSGGDEYEDTEDGVDAPHTAIRGGGGKEEHEETEHKIEARHIKKRICWIPCWSRLELKKSSLNTSIKTRV